MIATSPLSLCGCRLRCVAITPRPLPHQPHRRVSRPCRECTRRRIPAENLRISLNGCTPQTLTCHRRGWIEGDAKPSLSRMSARQLTAPEPARSPSRRGVGCDKFHRTAPAIYLGGLSNREVQRRFSILVYLRFATHCVDRPRASITSEEWLIIWAQIDVPLSMSADLTIDAQILRASD